MSDVFLSYKKEDGKIAENLANRLRAEGLSVWWDDGLRPNESWDATIEESLAAATTVVVLWSPQSVKSEWVRREAHYGQDRRKLVPVIVEPCEIPIAFTLNQTVNLTNWIGEPENKQWRKLLTWIADLATKPGESGSAPSINRFRDAIGYLKSGEPIADGTLVNASTPAGTLFRDGENLPVMRIVPAGTFLLGTTVDDEDHAPYETPQKRIDIPFPFAIGVFPVLASEYQPAKAEVGPAVPVTGVSFLQAGDFAAKLSAGAGASYRVPSEAEWEYACRAGSRTRYWHGDRIDNTRAAFGLANGPVECGQFAPNPFGLYDMHGNVREWAADLWHDSYERTPLDGRPAEDGHGSMRLVRGGGWSDQPATLRSATRMRATETVQSKVIGFRLVRAL